MSRSDLSDTPFVPEAGDDSTLMIVVDEQLRIVALHGDTDLAAVGERGDLLDRGSALGKILGEAFDALSSERSVKRRVAWDPTRDRHWIVEPRLLGETPYRARALAIDVTSAIVADRDRFLPKVAHVLRNVAFGIGSVLDVIELDGAPAAPGGEYLIQLRRSTERLMRLVHMVGELTESPPTLSTPLEVSSIVEKALANVREQSQATAISVRAIPRGDLWVEGDLVPLGEALAILVHTAMRLGSPSAVIVEIEILERGGRREVRLTASREGSTVDERLLERMREPLGSEGLDFGASIVRAQRIILAQGGRIVAERDASSRLRLGMCLPLVTRG